ncbi:MAG: homoserine dehydrogenase [Acidobacteria bacterium]|nr:homoserine dehydrogenase [Acidobacteriota bacterium]MBV9483864.1 homoserine dehydrogenase [Acidobacteriota bacterium]
MPSVRECKIGLLGCGTVGQGVVELINRNRSAIRERSGVDLSLTRILVRDMSKPRSGVESRLLTNEPEQVIRNGCDVIVELVGGLEPARSFIERALNNRKPVVTANKALLALDGLGLLNRAAANRVPFGFEASVCAGIPIVRALQRGLVGNTIQSITGILNGTSNYILTRMDESHLEFDEALREAQAKGFAEADPALDIEGHDAAQKLKILSELAFAGSLPPNGVRVQGIQDIAQSDVEAARKLGSVIRLVAAAEAQNGGISLRVQPLLLPRAHPLASVRNENNAVLVKGDAVGEMLFQGKGAGSLPSASAVLSDIVEIASNRRAVPRTLRRALSTTEIDLEYARYVRFPVPEPSAIGTITTTLAKYGIAVARAAATWARRPGERHEVKLMTLPCKEARLKLALREIVASGTPNGNYLAVPLVA